MTARPLLALALPVKNEVSAFQLTLLSAGAADLWVVLDTGSTDGTQGAVRGMLRHGDLLVEEPALGAAGDYAAMRNRALDVASERVLAGGGGFVLSVSADEVLVGGDRLAEQLSSVPQGEDAVLVEVRTPFGSFEYPRLLRAGSPWRYEGAIHEEPRCQGDPGRVPRVRLEGARIEYGMTDPIRFEKRLRERDLPEMEVARGRETDSARRARAAILLAQAREQLAASGESVDRAVQDLFSALGWYLSVAMDDAAPGGARSRARWKYLNVAEQLGVYTSPEMLARLRPIAETDSDSPEVAYMVAVHTARVDARDGVKAALRAAEVARRAVRDPARAHDPHGLLWRPYLIAAACSRALGHAPAARKHAVAGVDAGGPAEAFAEFLK